MTQRLKAIPTTYHGIEFRSKLEAKYAQAFDRLGIVWEYEGHGFRFDDGTCYCPDFYMPEIDTYFEVKGVLDEESRRKVELLAKEGKTIVVGMPDGKIIGHWHSYEYTGRLIDMNVLVCDVCKRGHFSPFCWDEPCDRVSCLDSAKRREHAWKNQEKYGNVFEAAGWESGR